MNETYYIKLNGKANIPERLEIGHNFRITADCSITSEQKIDNNNGEFDVVFKAEPVTVEITKSNGAIIRARDPRRNSQKIRNYLFKEYHNEGYVEDFDQVYDEFSLVVMSHTPALLREAIKRLEERQ